MTRSYPPLVDWNRPDWGGHSYESSTGSHVPDAPKEEL